MTTVTVGKLSYDSKNILGEGNFGTVFSGFYTIVSRGSEWPTPVAVKRVNRGRVDESVFQQEEKLLKTAGNHPNILSCIHTEMNAEFL